MSICDIRLTLAVQYEAAKGRVSTEGAASYCRWYSRIRIWKLNYVAKNTPQDDSKPLACYSVAARTSSDGPPPDIGDWRSLEVVQECKAVIGLLKYQ